MTARVAIPFIVIGRILFGLYAWLVFVIFALLALIVTVLVPSTRWRHELAAAAARGIFTMTGTAPRITGLENIPDGHCVVVANHASYADGILLKGFLPARFSFVIKGEMRAIPIAHFLLRRAGSHFVERFAMQGSSRDARRIVKAAQKGQSLAFFPEGTFRSEPGVGRFHAGAFVAAVRGRMPVIPVAIAGTRKLLPAHRAWPWPSRLQVDILPAIDLDDPAFASHRELAEAARQQVLGALNEPDLAARERSP